MSIKPLERIKQLRKNIAVANEALKTAISKKEMELITLYKNTCQSRIERIEERIKAN